MGGLFLLGLAAAVACAAVVGERCLERRAARRAEDRRLAAVFAVLRLYGEQPRRRGRWR